MFGARSPVTSVPSEVASLRRQRGLPRSRPHADAAMPAFGGAAPASMLVDYKIANAGAPRNMKLQSFNGRTESYPSGAQNPLVSHVSRSEQKSGYQKYRGMFEPVGNGRFWSKIRGYHREHDNEH
jgi:hypothetical protein